MWRLPFIVVLGCAQPKQPLQASYFNAEKQAKGPANCERVLACYAQCNPLTEECMIQCDYQGQSMQVQRARAVSYCSAKYGCVDDACTQERCAQEVQICKAPPAAPPPTAMRPAPIMRPPSAGPPPAMHPAPPMQPPPTMHPPPPMQPQPMYPPPGPPPPPPR